MDSAFIDPPVHILNSEDGRFSILPYFEDIFVSAKVPLRQFSIAVKPIFAWCEWEEPKHCVWLFLCRQNYHDLWISIVSVCENSRQSAVTQYSTQYTRQSRKFQQSLLLAKAG